MNTLKEERENEKNYNKQNILLYEKNKKLFTYAYNARIEKLDIIIT